jgi:rubrerythrin
MRGRPQANDVDSRGVNPNPPTHGPVLDLIPALEEARAAEKEQALFYRALAAEAEDRGDAAMSERFNELHADEQHHVSRLSARLLELGAPLADIANLTSQPVGMDAWEAAAQIREDAEVLRYEGMLGGGLDAETRALIEEILDTERHHAAELGGKWTTA